MAGPQTVRTPRLGRWLAARRLAWAMTQDDMALLMGVTKRQVRRYEAGLPPPAHVLGRVLGEAEKRGEEGIVRAYQMLHAATEAA